MPREFAALAAALIAAALALAWLWYEVAALFGAA